MEIPTTKYINVNGSLLDLSKSRVMGVLNVTPDSFYAGSRTQTEVEIARRVKQIVSEGAAIIDIGAYSSPSQCRQCLCLGGDGTVAYGLENTF